MPAATTPDKLQPPSRISLLKIAQQVMRLVKQDGFDRADAIKVIQIAQGMQKAEPEVLKEMQKVEGHIRAKL